MWARFGSSPGRACFHFPRYRAMRIISLILVALGGLALGWEACAAATGATGLVPPVVSGIVLVLGLLVLAATNRTDED